MPRHMRRVPTRASVCAREALGRRSGGAREGGGGGEARCEGGARLQLRAQRARRDGQVDAREQPRAHRERAEGEELGGGLGVLALLRDAQHEVRARRVGAERARQDARQLGVAQRRLRRAAARHDADARLHGGGVRVEGGHVRLYAHAADARLQPVEGRVEPAEVLDVEAGHARRARRRRRRDVDEVEQLVRRQVGVGRRACRVRWGGGAREAAMRPLPPSSAAGWGRAARHRIA